MIKRGAYVLYVSRSVTNSDSTPPLNVDTSRNNFGNGSSDNSDLICDTDARNDNSEVNENNDQVRDHTSNSNRRFPRVKYPYLKNSYVFR